MGVYLFASVSACGVYFEWSYCSLRILYVFAYVCVLYLPRCLTYVCVLFSACISETFIWNADMCERVPLCILCWCGCYMRVREYSCVSIRVFSVVIFRVVRMRECVSVFMCRS